jgi:hypothetical protein
VEPQQLTEPLGQPELLTLSVLQTHYQSWVVQEVVRVEGIQVELLVELEETVALVLFLLLLQLF